MTRADFNEKTGLNVTNEEYANILSIYKSLARRIIAKAVEYDDQDLYEIGKELVGDREAIMITLESGNLLWNSDREYIITHLK